MEVELRAKEELRSLLEFARLGGEDVVPRVRAMLDERPELWALLGDLAGKAETELIRAITGRDWVMAEALARRVAALKVELVGTSPTPIRRLLAERAALNWLHVHWAEAVVARSSTSDSTSIRQAASAQDHLDRAQRRYLAALGALKTVQRLPPTGKKRATALSAESIANESEAANADKEVAPEIPRVTGGGGLRKSIASLLAWSERTWSSARLSLFPGGTTPGAKAELASSS
jgi:hypothetical protein